MTGPTDTAATPLVPDGGPAVQVEWARTEVERLTAITEDDARYAIAQQQLAYWRGFLSRAAPAADDSRPDGPGEPKELH